MVFAAPFFDLAAACVIIVGSFDRRVSSSTTECISLELRLGIAAF